MPKIADEYANHPITLKPGDRLHRLVAILYDTYYDDLTDDRIRDLERHIESWRWCNAAGKRIEATE